MRTFVGIPLPGSFREWMQGFGAAVKCFDSPVRVVPPKTCHVTLCFLGDIQPVHVDVLADRLKTTVARHRALNIDLDCLGVFRHGEDPSVLWAGCSRENRALSELAAAVGEACSDIMKRNRERFLLHVTLARFVGSGGVVDTRTMSRAFPGPYSFLATHVVLFESILGLGTPEYRSLLSIPLPSVAE